MLLKYKLLREDIRYEELRLDKEMKQGDIAEVLNVKVNTYSKWENCINDMPLEKCIELANYYNVSADYLLGLTNSANIESSSNNIDWEKLKNRLLELRKNHNYTQEELGDKLGFRQVTYSQYERGLRKPTTLKLLVIAQFYSVSIDYLIGKKSTPEIN